MNDLILKKAMELIDISITVPRDEQQDYLIQAQDLLLEYLEIYPKDTKAWQLLTLLECNPPFYDPERIIKYTSAVLSYDTGNVYALLLLSYADYYLMGSQDNELVGKLSQAKSDDQGLLSLIEIAKARSWEFRNKEEYEKCLLKSIEFCKNYVTNYVMLGEFYITQKKYREAMSLIQQALFNRDRIYISEDAGICHPADINGLLKEFFICAGGIDNRLRAFVNEQEGANIHN